MEKKEIKEYLKKKQKVLTELTRKWAGVKVRVFLSLKLIF